MTTPIPLTGLHVTPATLESSGQHPVKASIYVDAIMRHLAAWFDSEEEAEDSGVHHLGHVAACCAILMDAQAMNALLDDRPGEQSGDTPIIGPAPSVIRSLTKR